MFLYRMEPTYPDFKFQLAAVEGDQSAILSAITFGAFAQGITLNAFSVRQARHAYGLMNLIEGTPNALPTVLLNDIANSPSGFRRCYDVCMQQKIPVAPVSFAILNKVDKTDAARLAVDALLPPTMKTLWLLYLDDFGLGAK